MTRLPVLSGRQVVAALSKIDYRLDHQEGSHIIMRNVNPPYRRVSVPDHKTVAKGTLRAIIRQAGLTVEEFTQLL